MVQNPADLYSITRPQLLTLDRMGSRLADRILANIEASKQQPLHRVLYSLGIFRLGRTVSRILGRPIRRHRRHQPPGRGRRTWPPSTASAPSSPAASTPVSAPPASGRHWTKCAALELICKLKSSGTTPRPPPPGTRPWTGLNFVVTGKLGGMTRPQAERAIQELGGAAAGSVTKITDYLVCGEKPGSKLAKARQLDVNIVTEAEFLNALNRPQNPHPKNERRLKPWPAAAASPSRTTRAGSPKPSSTTKPTPTPPGRPSGAPGKSCWKNTGTRKKSDASSTTGSPRTSRPNPLPNGEYAGYDIDQLEDDLDLCQYADDYPPVTREVQELDELLEDVADDPLTEHLYIFLNEGWWDIPGSRRSSRPANPGLRHRGTGRQGSQKTGNPTELTTPTT